jgi:tetratricopeptide (TPR) repeat protein
MLMSSAGVPAFLQSASLVLIAWIASGASAGERAIIPGAASAEESAARVRLVDFDARGWTADGWSGRFSPVYDRCGFGYGGYAGYYGYGYPYYDPATEVWRLYQVYKRIRTEQFNERDMAQRAERLLRSHAEALRVGLTHLQRGDYSNAVIALTLAAELNHGDPASRIHLAQARLALGHYRDAGASLRRALELQPKLAYIPLNLESYYPSPNVFGRDVDAFAAKLREESGTTNEYFALGFFQLQRGSFAEANAALRKAHRAMPKDTLTRDLVKVSKPPARTDVPASPGVESPASSPKQRSRPESAGERVVMRRP